MDKTKFKVEARKRRHRSVRNRVLGMAERPRLAVFRSNKGIYAQVINDVDGRTLVSASTVDKELRKDLNGRCNRDVAAKVGELLAKRAVAAGVKSVVFDRGGFLFHGRVKALADAARAGGLEF